ncbi:HAD family hydrolase [Microbacterium allomyrinae]|nr:HAD family phosphatase [Microbacterium allomyrinae]
MNPPRLAAVLWDMDGTLVDTEPYWMAAETPLVERFGGTWSHEQALALVGLGLEDSARIFQAAGVRMSVDAIIDHLTDEVMRALATTGVPFRPGARELLADLRGAGIKTALVTMSMRRMAQTVVDLIDFPAFDVVIAGDDATRPKPFPDPYLQACEALGVSPEETVAIEDSPNGLRSAVAAGTSAIGVPLMVSVAGAGAHAVWPTLEGRSAQDVASFHSAHRAAQESTR